MALARDPLFRLASAATALELVALRVTAGPARAIDLAAAVALLGLVAGLAHLTRDLGAVPRATARGLTAALYLSGLLGTTFIERGQWIAAFALAPALSLLAWDQLRRGQEGWGARHQIVAMAAAVAYEAFVRAGTNSMPWPALAAVAGAAITVGLVGPRGVVLGLIALWPAAPPTPWTATGPTPEGPDVVLVVVDTLRHDRAEAMASFRRVGGGPIEAQAAAPWTLPSMTSLMTGREVASHAVAAQPDGSFSRRNPAHATLAERFAEAAYDTAATAENPFVGRWFGFASGFARFDHDDEDPWPMPGAPFAPTARSSGAALAEWIGLTAPAPAGVDRRLAFANATLADRRDRPVFLWIHLLDVHRPYRRAWSLDLPWSSRAWLAWSAWPTATWADRPDEVLAAYDNEVAYVDRALDAWLAAMPAPGPRGRIVVLTSDHGEEFGEHKGWEHGHTMYQELLSVPLSISGIPGVRGPAGHIDVAPTLLTAAGLPADGLDGRALQGANAPGPYRSMTTWKADPSWRAWREGSHKVVARDGHPTLRFDLGADPGERQGVPDPSQEHLLPALPTSTGDVIDPELEEQLRRIGYRD